MTCSYSFGKVGSEGREYILVEVDVGCSDIHVEVVVVDSYLDSMDDR